MIINKRCCTIQNQYLSRISLSWPRTMQSFEEKVFVFFCAVPVVLLVLIMVLAIVYLMHNLSKEAMKNPGAFICICIASSLPFSWVALYTK